MRVAILAFVAVSALGACSRRVDHTVRPLDTPSARGGGPASIVTAEEARAKISEARCTLREACGDGDAPDACRARVEAETKLDCAIAPARLEACIEAVRARTCTDSAAPAECADVCINKEDSP